MPLHKHLNRLDRIWVSNPRYLITVCTHNRRKILADKRIAAVFRQEWEGAWDRHGWAVGSFVIMPDHIHFFCTDGERGTTLSRFVGGWKEWTAKALKRELDIEGAVWQKGFFDHLLRSSESYSEKWDYVRENPVRAGLIASADKWPFQGHIHYL